MDPMDHRDPALLRLATCGLDSGGVDLAGCWRVALPLARAAFVRRWLGSVAMIAHVRAMLATDERLATATFEDLDPVTAQTARGIATEIVPQLRAILAAIDRAN